MRTLSGCRSNRRVNSAFDGAGQAADVNPPPRCREREASAATPCSSAFFEEPVCAIKHKKERYKKRQMERLVKHFYHLTLNELPLTQTPADFHLSINWDSPPFDRQPLTLYPKFYLAGLPRQELSRLYQG